MKVGLILQNPSFQLNPQRERHRPIPPVSFLKNRSDTGSTTKAISKAFSALYVYDYLLTVGDEVRSGPFHPFISSRIMCDRSSLRGRDGNRGVCGYYPAKFLLD